MDIGMIGLGKMGSNISRRLLGAGHRVVVYDTSPETVSALAGEGAAGALSLFDLCSQLPQPRAIWVMVPAGAPTESTINTLSGILSAGDVVIDGGNSNYNDTVRRSKVLASRGIALLDAGTSGGIWGLKEGYCLMVGGEKAAFEAVEPLFKSLAPSPEHGYAHVGPSGSGHFVKMVHNGIEYGLMQAYAEGFELLKVKKDFALDIAQISELWRYGSVVRSWLLDLAASALAENPDLTGIESWVADSGEGRWTAAEGIDLGVPLPVITAALQARYRSRQEHPFSGKLLAALRGQFGGHEVRTTEE
ncbi:phosphogluconate dehydrogenase (NAD(+)-dependent, decarboxylating) [Dehalogenimonas sp. THU2]|uniref:phosphogluconate dehydrogenase (NAD(+)-dependent, decarboxylating) n=1 Tax=Dehalogenimonas sp. THU2 TaxID=3151121 RepID=UPI00321892BB